MGGKNHIIMKCLWGALFSQGSFKNVEICKKRKPFDGGIHVVLTRKKGPVFSTAIAATW